LIERQRFIEGAQIEPTRLTRKKDLATIGILKDDPDFDEAVRLGREYRQQQTYEKEIAGA